MDNSQRTRIQEIDMPLEEEELLLLVSRYLREGRRTIPRVLVEQLLGRIRHYQSRSAAYLDVIVDLGSKVFGAD